jgi:hypothetical protein
MLSRPKRRNVQADVRDIEQKVTRYLKLTLLAVLVIVLCAQQYQRSNWEQFRTAHGCEPTLVADTETLAYTVSVWSCDDGRTYVR